MASLTKPKGILKNNNYQRITRQSRIQSVSDVLSSTSIQKGSQTKVLTLLSNASAKSARAFAKINQIFVDDHLEDKKESFSYHDPQPLPQQQHTNYSNSSKGSEDGVSAKFEDIDYLYRRQNRLAAGAHRHATDKLSLSASQCKLQPAGLEFFDAKEHINVINLQLNDVQMNASVPQRRSAAKSRTRATQTLFRESSAQTLPYLPEVSNNVKDLETLELFKLPAILPGNGPPGLYEVEVLERARRRWAFAKALKENFRKQLKAAKEQAHPQEHEHILEAFEWEHWIEREENIQECQMLRLELLIRMFDEREREMHIASSTRIQKSHEEIEAKRKAALKKNEIEYQRAIRRLDIKHAKQPRVWRKEHITEALGEPSSEFYAPKIRYGVSPSRRHYTALRAGFDMRMDNLEKKAIKMDAKSLNCPFAKLRQWSKPKQVLREVEQNFCSDVNLDRLYVSLRTLREISAEQKYTPLCLKSKKPQAANNLEESAEEVVQSVQKADDDISKEKSSEHISPVETKRKSSSDLHEHGTSFEEVRQQKQAERANMEIMRKEMCCEELEALISSYEGNTIGWLMRFLSEEMCRLKEQRKLQFLTMMAKRERWHREAAEAGLRQKENCMRETYENIYQDCNEINKEIADKFLKSLLSKDIEDYAHDKAEQDVVRLAKELDKEISGWLESFEEVQHPLNYHTLRYALKDIFMPDADKKLYHLEKDSCIDYIINDVIMAKVYHDLEPYDITFNIANDFMDRLLDNDLYLNSPDYSSDCDRSVYSDCSEAQIEAEAIIRKIIRYVVPGRRWYNEEERIVADNICDLLDDVCNKVITTDNIMHVDISNLPDIPSHGAHTDLVFSEKNIIPADLLDESLIETTVERRDDIKFKTINPASQFSASHVTKTLKWDEKLLLIDPDELSNDNFLINVNEYAVPKAKPKLSVLHMVPSTHDLSSIHMFDTTPNYTQTSSEEDLERMQLEAEEIRDEISMDYEDFPEQLDHEIGQEELEEQEEENLEEVQQEIEAEIEEYILDKNVAKDLTVKIQEIPEEKIIDAEVPEEEDDNASELMKVSFSYDPKVKFSVAMPSNGDSFSDETADYVSDNVNMSDNEQN